MAYEIADSDGLKGGRLTGGSVIGILKPREPIQKSFLGLKWNKKQKELHIGNLWQLSEKWLLEVYGGEYVSELTELVKEISQPSQAKVEITLMREEPQVALSSYVYQVDSDANYLFQYPP